MLLLTPPTFHLECFTSAQVNTHRASRVDFEEHVQRKPRRRSKLQRDTLVRAQLESMPTYHPIFLEFVTLVQVCQVKDDTTSSFPYRCTVTDWNDTYTHARTHILPLPPLLPSSPPALLSPNLADSAVRTDDGAGVHKRKYSNDWARVQNDCLYSWSRLSGQLQRVSTLSLFACRAPSFSSHP